MTRAATRMLPVALAALAAAACEPGPKETVQLGFRGLGLEQVSDPDSLTRAVARAVLPDPIPATPATASTAPGTWQNVQVLTDVSLAEFNRTMVAMTQWVSPEQGCNYCHVPGNFASDSIYTKVVARTMMRMVRDVNRDWTSHVGETGVTCWSCHRGQPVPENVWFFTPETQPLRHYLDREDARVQSASWAPSDANRSSIKQTEYTYALMLSMSRSLGVNCTYCHNSPRWSSWEQSTPQRVTALRGIRMARAINNDYLLPLQPVFPAERLGPHGDVAKVQCATCHQGAYKPLFGAKITAQYPAMYWQHSAGGAVQPDPTAPLDSLGAAVPTAAGAPIPVPVATPPPGR